MPTRWPGRVRCTNASKRVGMPNPVQWAAELIGYRPIVHPPSALANFDLIGTTSSRHFSCCSHHAHLHMCNAQMPTLGNPAAHFARCAKS